MIVFQISTEPESESNEFAQSTSTSKVEARQSTSMKSETSTSSTPNLKKISNQSPKTDESGKSKKATKKLKRLSKKKHLKTKNQNSLTTSPNESINIDVNIQDVTLKRTLTKRNFFKKKKLSVNG